jgi:Flp pilus assembly protein TadG
VRVAGRTTKRVHGPGGRRERGVAVVEFALVLPLLVMLLLGIVSSGMAYNQKLGLTHATREAARYGASTSPAQAWASGTWATNVRDMAVARSGGELTADQVCVALVVSTSTTASAVYTGSGNPATYYTTNAGGQPCYTDTYAQYSSADNGLRVQIAASKPGKIELAVLPPVNITLRSNATAKLEPTS